MIFFLCLLFYGHCCLVAWSAVINTTHTHAQYPSRWKKNPTTNEKSWFFFIYYLFLLGWTTLIVCDSQLNWWKYAGTQIEHTHARPPQSSRASRTQALYSIKYGLRRCVSAFLTVCLFTRLFSYLFVLLTAYGLASCHWPLTATHCHWSIIMFSE